MISVHEVHSLQGSPAGRLLVLAVERLGEDPRGDARLTDAANAREEIGLRNPVFGSDGVLQRRDDRLLADDARKILRAPLAGENLVGHVGESKKQPRCLLPLDVGSSRVKGSGDLRHPAIEPYRCSLPGLTRFGTVRCTGPEPFVKHWPIGYGPTDGGCKAMFS